LSIHCWFIFSWRSFALISIATHIIFIDLFNLYLSWLFNVLNWSLRIFPYFS
jgi:hypothetical protein